MLKGYRVALVLIALLGVLFSVAVVGCGNNSPPDESVIDEVRQSIYSIDKFKDNIKEVHSLFNEKVCYEKWERLENGRGWEEFEVVYEEDIKPNVREVWEKTQNKELKKDMENVLKLLQEGIDNRNVEALIEAHRVLHDLDRFVFNPVEGKKYYGVTNLLAAE